MRNAKMTILVMVVVLATTSMARATYDWYTYNGHQYALTVNWSSWAECEAEAISAGGHLVTINDEAENTWLTNFTRGVGGDNAVWIGLEYVSGDINLATSWEWQNGEPITYFFDSSYSLTGMHMYLHTGDHSSAGTWNNNPLHDIEPTAYIPGVIEIPEPATLVLLGLGAMMVRRKRS